MDRCQMLWNSANRVPLLSTVTLLRIGDRCIDRDDTSFTELYELAVERNNELHGCLNRYHNQVCYKYDIKFLNCIIILFGKLGNSMISYN